MKGTCTEDTRILQNICRATGVTPESEGALALHSFKAQFSDIPDVVRMDYDNAVQCSTTPPWQCIVTALMCNLNALRFPAEVSDASSNTLGAQTRTLRSSSVWAGIRQLMRDIADSDEALLDPRRPWRDGSMSTTLARTPPSMLDCTPAAVTKVVDAGNTKMRDASKELSGGRVSQVRPVIAKLPGAIASSIT